MGQTSRQARLRMINVFHRNTKNHALKLLNKYSNSCVCWQALNACYENNSGPCCVMSIEKFFGLCKANGISMDARPTKIKNVIDMLEEVNLVFLKYIIVYYTIQNLPKEYKIFKKIHLGGDELPGYENMESKFFREEMAFNFRIEDNNA
jgi:hypothetical protein